MNNALLTRLLATYRRINRPHPPEESWVARVWVLVTVLIAQAAVLTQGYYDLPSSLAIPLLSIAGFYLSYRYRHSSQIWLKAALSVVVVVIGIFFLKEVASNPYDTRLPLIKLFLWLGVLHSFDVPASKDLRYSLVTAMILVVAGAVLSTSTTYGLWILLFSLSAITSLLALRFSKGGTPLKSLGLRLSAVSAVFLGCALVIMAPLYLLLPQNENIRLRLLPFSIPRIANPDFSSQPRNPGYLNEGNPFNAPPQFNPSSYFGFNPYLDLRSRGRLNRTLAFRVRSTTPTFYRGLVFDTYNGKGWEITHTQTKTQMGDPPLRLNLPDATVLPTQDVVQTFFIESDQANLIFAGFAPSELYFPSSLVKVDDYSSLRSPFALDKGLTYSVLSKEPLARPDLLRRYPIRESAFQPRYLDLPASTDLAQIRALALEITSPHETRYDKVKALENYLESHYAYDLNIPVQTQERDAVGYFLFGPDGRGYCEQFSSALAVMSRSIGIPSRLVTGYAQGTQNPFTRLWEVRARDAHAWVEIDFGEAGWIPFDPTPGFSEPSREEGFEASTGFGRYLADLWGDTPVWQGAAAVLAGAWSLLSHLDPLKVSLVGLLVLTGAGGAFLLARGAVSRYRLYLEIRRGLVKTSEIRGLSLVRRYNHLLVALARKGYPRGKSEPLLSHARRLEQRLALPGLQDAAQGVESLCYGPKEAGHEATQPLEKVCKDLEEALKKKV